MNLLALLARFSNACRIRVWSAFIVPISAGQATTTLLSFLVAIVAMVCTTSVTSGAMAKDSM
ncbi:MAG: hypothetical protein IPM02_16430 [Betaproteobacteria bacterium]|nr:hypothetical protein [Betaproteobacteria bacterium]